MCHLCQIDAGPWLDLGPYQRMSVFICHATGGMCEDWDPYKGANKVVLHREQNNMLFDGPPTVRVYRRFKLTVDEPYDESVIWESPEDERHAAVESLRYDKLGGGAVWLHRDASPLTVKGNPMKMLLQVTTDLVKFDITNRGMAYIFIDTETAQEGRGYMLWQGL